MTNNSRKKTEAIPNQYDGPRKPENRLPSGRFSLDYAGSDDPFEIDTGIRETIKGVRLSILAMGIGLAKIKAKGLYVDLEFHSMAKYIESLCEQTQMDRSSIHNWLYIGETYLKYRKELERVGFSEEDGPTKLPYVERALEIYQKKDVFRAVKEMSLRQFAGFAKGEKAAVKPSAVWVKGGRVYIGSRAAVTLDEGLDPKTRAYLEKVIMEAGEALESGEVLYITRLYDMDELRRFERAAERLKKELRGKA
ncbi:MAG: hypothetical protein LBP76_10995 [Treponema sp.]|jgi:hypothetical protein|nr:hypothetical protein [Treponema sp.]